MLTTATITFDISDQLGNDFDPRRTKVWVTTNTDTVIDTTGDKIRLGSGTATLNADGTGSIVVWVPGTGSNPASWQTTVHVDYPDRNADRGRRTKDFGPFTITTSANLADLVAEMPVQPEYASALTTRVAALEAGGGGGGGGVAGVSSVNTRSGAVTLTKSDVGLSNVDNTSDANKPVSTAQALALAANASASTDYTDTEVQNSYYSAIVRANHTGTQAQSTVTNLVTDLAAKADALTTINAQTGTTYTAVQGDSTKLVTLTNAAAITVTLPNTLTIGTRIDFAALGAGMATFVGSGGATITATPSAVTRATGSAASAIKITSTVFLLVGDLA